MLRNVAVVVFVLSIVAFTWGFADAVATGTCASGGPYVVAQECPDGTGWTFAGLFFGAIGAVFGITVLAIKRMPWGLAAFGAFMAALGASFLIGEVTSDNLEGTGWFLGPFFVLFGALPLVSGLRIDHRMRTDPDYRAPAHDELLDGFAEWLQKRRERKAAQRESA